MTDTGLGHAKTAILMGEMTVPHLRAVYHAFDGDLLLALVLGELSHRSLSKLFERHGGEHPDLDQWLRLPEDERARYLRPCNAFSLAEATGIPRETVRRKVKILVDKGWVHEAPNKQLTITDEPARLFAPLYLSLSEQCTRIGEALRGGTSYTRPAGAY
ncbi:helix-turn-helix domain-containing protein [Crenobacter intestini]|uniref:Crp/Fnr family transcriptional regulator n=1 Tax=Crenobacter intestini TaxID=2563443 RepID=A0A4T0UT44_9NEIS|nr:Crp/Fnr family transcriptional regulator [Crenobacter intestini]TIC82092.1 Crp/Fnr family transcriptional regulator [Crenobacter intestini]